MKKIILYIFILIQGYNISAQQDTVIYSFFSAGHTYGNPGNPHYGLHYPFSDYIPDLNNYPKMALGFLTGDVVVSATAEYWDSAQVDIDKFNMPIYIAAGNHDIGQEFVNRFGDYYYSFKYNNDLFIVLTPGLDAWNITAAQLDFLENTLDSNYATTDNIFIFMHELIWWSPTNEYQSVIINYEPHYPGSTNFDTIVKPLLLSYPNNVTIYAGDLGCINSVSPFMFHQFDNITLIGSGMGGGIRDNIIITDVYQDSVYYNLVALNDTNPDALGELYDYTLSTPEVPTEKNRVSLYPNPSEKGFFYVKNNTGSDLNMKVINIQGKLVHKQVIHEYSTTTIKSACIIPGMYIISLFNDKHCYQEKILIQ